MKIAVITCVNNEEEYAQALSYIDRLHVPDGYELDVIAVREAPSMAARLPDGDGTYRCQI